MGKIIQTGTRARFKALMDPGRAVYPRDVRRLSTKDANGEHRRRCMLTHPVSWYLDGHLETRPVTAAYAYAVFAEHCLAKAKKSGDVETLRAATDLFADTRRLMEFIRCNFRAGSRVRGKKALGMLPRVARMTEKARGIWGKLHPRKECNADEQD